MRFFYSLITFTLLPSLGFVSGRWEPGLDEDQYAEIPRPTPDPLLYQGELKHGPILMETRLGSPRNGTSPRDLALGARQLNCNPGYTLACPITRPSPCCPETSPICCQNSSSTVCCAAGTFCVGLATCCVDGQVACTSPEGCCAPGTRCCGLYCCPPLYECINEECVQVAYGYITGDIISVSLRSAGGGVDAKATAGGTRSGTSATVTEYITLTVENLPANISGTGNCNGNNNRNVALVGGVVGGVLGAALLGLLGLLLWRRTKGVPSSSSAGQQQFVQQPSSQPIAPASQTFSTNSNYIRGPPVTHAAQSRFYSQ